MKLRVKKLLGIPFLVLFLNLVLMAGSLEVFTNINTLLPILFFNGFLSADIVIRLVSQQKDQYKKRVLVISFLLMPLLCALPYWEHLWTSGWVPFVENPAFLVTGMVTLIAGGTIAILARLQLGEYGGPKIVIEEEHQLVTTGIYRHVRHPMYAGFLLLFAGYGLAFGSVATPAGFFVGLFCIFRGRIILEEKLLQETFGARYVAYAERTWRLYPMIY